MIFLVVSLARSAPAELDLSLPPPVVSRGLDRSLPVPHQVRGQPLLAGLAAGLGQAASPSAITGPTQSLHTRADWLCLGLDNATLDAAHRCPYVGLTRRGVR